MKIIVTGAAGFIGTHLCAELSRHSVIGFDLRPKRRGPTSSNYQAQVGVSGDCSTSLFPQLLDGEQPELVIHLAAKVGRLFGEDDVQKTISDNAGVTAHVAKACGERNIRLIYASTSEVYGDWNNQICHEADDLTRIPHNMYGLSKRWGEEACKLYAPHNLTLMRLSMPYGPGLPAGRGRAAIINFLYQALHREPITVHKNSERSWCWVGDTVRAIRLLVENPRAGAFNIGRDDDPRPMRAIAELACDLTGAPHDLIEMIDPPERQTVVKRLATDKIRSLGWKPEVELEEGMGRVLEWVREKYPAPVAA